MECSVNYTHDCSILLSSVVMTMLVFMVSTIMIIYSYVTKKNEMDVTIDLSYDEPSETNYDTDIDEDVENKSRKITFGNRRRTNRYRDMDLLSHGQKIRYVYEDCECLGIYNIKSRMFVSEKGKSFETPSAFARNHLLEMKMNGKMKSGRETFQVNGWTDCECEVNGLWVSLDDYVHNYRKFLFQC